MAAWHGRVSCNGYPLIVLLVNVALFIAMDLLKSIPSGPTDVLFAGTDIDGSNPYFKGWFYGTFSPCLIHLRHHMQLTFVHTCLVAY